jgi:hypothetical protein
MFVRPSVGSIYKLSTVIIYLSFEDKAGISCRQSV